MALPTNLVEAIVAQFVRGFNVETDRVVCAENIFHSVSDGNEDIVMPCSKCARQGDSLVFECREIRVSAWIDV